MANTLRNIVIGTMTATVMIYLFLLFAIYGGEAYGKDTSEFTGPTFNFTDLNKSIYNASKSSETWRDVLSADSTLELAWELLTNAVLGLANGIANFVTTPIYIMINIATNVLNLPPVLVNVIATFLTTILFTAIVFGIWRFIKVGD